MDIEAVGVWAGFVLTLMVFSYVLGDNFLYRLAVYVFVGLAAGYIAIVTVESVLLPWFNTTILSGDPGRTVLGLIPVLLGALLLVKTSSRIGQIGNLAIAFIVGIGAAVALVGAVTGTLFPLALNAADSTGGNVLNVVIVFLGVVSSLIYFQYLARRLPNGAVRRNRPVQALSTIGQGFIVTTLGALYAGAILTSLTIFSERVAFIAMQVSGLIGGG